MIKAIDKKLENAKTVTLITDIWTNKIFTDFLALAVLYLIKIQTRTIGDRHGTNDRSQYSQIYQRRYEFNKRLAKGTNLDF